MTFTKDVAPILQRSCQNCHRPGAIAPMSLLTYEEARPWARSIKQKVVAREMPPWHIDRNIGITQVQGRSLADRRRDRDDRQWVDSGAPMGNPADMPQPRQFADLDKWYIGKPDIVVTMDKPYVLPAGRPRQHRRRARRSRLQRRHVHHGDREQAGRRASFKVVHHFTTNLVEDRGRGSGRASSSTSTRSARTATSSRPIRGGSSRRERRSISTST